MAKRTLPVAFLVLFALSAACATQVIYAPRVQVQNRLMVPLRGVLESLGFQVSYEKIMGDAMIGIEPTDNCPPGDVTYVELIVGQRQAHAYSADIDNVIYMDVPPRIIGNRTYVPVRFVAETFGYDVEYKGSHVDFIWGDNVAVRLALGSRRAVQPVPRPEPAPETEPVSDQLAPWSAWRKLNDADLVGWGNWELTLVRNEIYARHGRTFNNVHLRRYFMARDWYRADRKFTEKRLNPVERYNVDYIKRYQTNVFGKPATAP